MSLGACFKKFTSLMLARVYSVKIGVIFGVWVERQKIGKKQTYMKTETCKLYSRDFWIFLPNIIKIDHYSSELFRFKVGAFFETQCIKRQCDHWWFMASYTDVIDSNYDACCCSCYRSAQLSKESHMVLQGNHLMQVMLPTSNESSIVICIHCIKADVNVKL